MATEILAVGSAAASSSEQTVATGVFARLLLKPAVGAALQLEARVAVEIKTADSTWVRVGDLAAQGPERIAADIIGPCTYRVTRPALASAHACGVDLA